MASGYGRLALVAGGLAIVAMLAPEGASGATRRCHDVVIRTGDRSVYTRTYQLRARRTTCRTARRVARIYLHGSEGSGTVRPLGFRCRNGADGVKCAKGRKRVTWSFRPARASLAARPPVLGRKGLMPYGKGWGTAHPAFIFNGGAPAGSVSHIHWRHWGARTATGAGRAPQYRPEGGYYAKLVRVQLRAKRLGRCPGAGRRAYTRLLARKQTRPGGPFGAWAPWALDLCDFDAEPTPCAPLTFAPDNGDGASEIVAWDTSCATARAVAGAAKAIRIDPGPHAGGVAAYRMKSHGFACSGRSHDHDQPQQILWSCLRGTAVVRFAAIVTRDQGPPQTRRRGWPSCCRG